MLTAPSLGYMLLSPMLIVFAAAVIGVLIEAFMGRAHRAAVHLTVSIGALLLSLLQLWRIRNLSSTTAAVDSVTIDKAGIFLQATVVILALIAVLLIADQDNFTAQASAIPGSNEEAMALQQKSQQTEIFPLFLFAVAGMMLFPVATDLITLFVALEVFSLPLYLLAGLSRRKRLLSQEAAHILVHSVTGIAVLATKCQEEKTLTSKKLICFNSWELPTYTCQTPTLGNIQKMSK